MTISAVEKLVTRPRPTPQRLSPPETQIRSTHCCVCPVCAAEARLKATPDGADLYGGCVHIVAIELAGNAVAVMFQPPPAPQKKDTDETLDKKESHNNEGS